MAQIVLIGIGAGAASALLFASVASGSLIALLLLYHLAPLPILIAALGWSHWAALVAALVAAAGLALALGGSLFLTFLFGIGLPAWWLGYLALLARPRPDGNLEWYPVGRIVMWAAVVGTLVLVAAIPGLGFDEETFRGTLRTGLEQFASAQQQSAQPGLDATTVERLVDFFVRILPAMAAVLFTVTIILNLWVAGKAVNFSNRLPRPWPDLADTRLPTMTATMLGVAVLGCFIPGLIGIIAGAFVATLLVVYAAMGLAVLHFITRGMTHRGLLLGGTYTALLILQWPVLLMSMFGLVDAAFDLRARSARKGGPPSPTGT